ncbi:unnamed protein product [Rangifer tarandus platyrhynchus]|uniref:Basic proline-rich protein-like n=2 Tax=Rangifer tarandus platyrhynchus TaxID=3082113 RepID=A0ABN8ZYC1_RANTA|nr:unnamed protein product [Rangifer tarandus platyrhynchus]CAI9712106.1 unnamed protein product [Rangifer tarandus platyrhynchus]
MQGSRPPARPPPQLQPAPRRYICEPRRLGPGTGAWRAGPVLGGLGRGAGTGGRAGAHPGAGAGAGAERAREGARAARRAALVQRGKPKYQFQTLGKHSAPRHRACAPAPPPPPPGAPPPPYARPSPAPPPGGGALPVTPARAGVSRAEGGGRGANFTRSFALARRAAPGGTALPLRRGRRAADGPAQNGRSRARSRIPAASPMDYLPPAVRPSHSPNPLCSGEIYKYGSEQTGNLGSQLTCRTQLDGPIRTRRGRSELGCRPLRRGLTTGNPRPPGAGGAQPDGSGRACALRRPRRPPARAGETYHRRSDHHSQRPRRLARLRGPHRPPLLCRRLEAGAERLGDKGAREGNSRRAPGEARRPFFSLVAWMPLLKSAPPVRNTTHGGAGPASSQGTPGGISLSVLGPPLPPRLCPSGAKLTLGFHLGPLPRRRARARVPAPSGSGPARWA